MNILINKQPSFKDIIDLKVILGVVKKKVTPANILDLMDDKIEFTIEGHYIEQSDFLRQLGILVYPKKTNEIVTDYGDNPFGPSDAVKIRFPALKTYVTFPTQLIMNEK